MGPMTPLGAVAVPSGTLALLDDVPGAVPHMLIGEPGLWRVEAQAGEGPDEGRWTALRVVPPAPTEAAEGCVASTSGRLLIADAAALESYFDASSVDGLGDCVFRGRDAREAARTLGAPELEGRLFGWLDEPATEARRLYKRVVFERDERGLSLTVEERPHSRRFRALEALSESPLAVAAVDLPGRPALLLSTTWGPCEARVESAPHGDGVRIGLAPFGGGGHHRPSSLPDALP
ncbi:MAG: hypothetical protein RL199_1456 [Pseudomonadota bacterium]|jgi:hypothetical protein